MINHDQSPLVSIVTPCYNGSRYIDRYFESILSQTYNNIELIFVNNNSTDDSVSKARTYEEQLKEKGTSIKIIDENKQGPCQACYAGFYMAAGDYMMFLDVDDVIMPESVRKQCEFLEANSDCDVVQTNGYMVYDNDLNHTIAKIVHSDNRKTKSFIYSGLLTGEVNNWAGAYMVRLKPIKDFYSCRHVLISEYGQNLQLLMPLSKNKNVGFIDEPLFKYIKHPGSHSFQKSYYKQLTLQEGYLDVRLKMLEMLGDDTEDNIRMAKSASFRQSALLALQYKENDEFLKHYRLMLDNGRKDLELKIQYYTVIRSPKKHLARLAFFIKRKFFCR